MNLSFIDLSRKSVSLLLCASVRSTAALKQHQHCDIVRPAADAFMPRNLYLHAYSIKDTGYIIQKGPSLAPHATMRSLPAIQNVNNHQVCVVSPAREILHHHSAHVYAGCLPSSIDHLDGAQLHPQKSSMQPSVHDAIDAIPTCRQAPRPGVTDHRSLQFGSKRRLAIACLQLRPQVLWQDGNRVVKSPPGAVRRFNRLC